tara:strand:- start:464 stop:619 length:156 start_codon:yes stop_codon:yes gene_type:complete
MSKYLNENTCYIINKDGSITYLKDLKKQVKRKKEQEQYKLWSAFHSGEITM